MKNKADQTWSTGGYEGIAKAIIWQAAFDLTSKSQTCERQGTKEVITGSARRFFRGEWFQVLADEVGYSADKARRHLTGAGLI